MNILMTLWKILSEFLFVAVFTVLFLVIVMLVFSLEVVDLKILGLCLFMAFVLKEKCYRFDRS